MEKYKMFELASKLCWIIMWAVWILLRRELCSVPPNQTSFHNKLSLNFSDITDFPKNDFPIIIVNISLILERISLGKGERGVVGGRGPQAAPIF